MSTLERASLGGGVEIAYREEGAGAPLLLLHGITEDHRAWDELAPRLARSARVIRLDLPGHGESSPLPAYSAFTLGDAVAGFVRALGLAEPPRVIGHSLGGLIATLLASQAPVRSVVNVDQSLRLGPFIELVRKLAPRLQGPDFSEALNEEMELLGGPRLPQAVREELRGYRVEERRPVVEQLWLPLVDQVEATLTETLRPVLAEVRAPYLSLHGNDPGPDYGAWLRSALPQAEVELWPGLGHWLHRVEPERFLTRIQELHLRS